jgi:hypothetical protein
VEYGITRLGRRAIGHQVQAPPGIKYRIKLRRSQEALQAQGLVLSRTQLIEFFGCDDDVPAGAVFVAAVDGGAVDGSMDGAVFRIAEALAAVGVQQMARRYVTGADGGIGPQRNTDQAELQ